MSRMIRIALVLAALVLAAGVLTGCGGDASGSLNGTSWRLTGWSVSSQQASDFDITLKFEDDKMTGQAPVNGYGGDVTFGSGGSFEPGDINRTLIAGPEPQMQAEETYFKLLEQTEKYRVEGDTLTLLDGNGNEVLVFTAEK